MDYENSMQNLIACKKGGTNSTNKHKRNSCSRRYILLKLGLEKVMQLIVTFIKQWSKHEANFKEK